MFQENSQDQNLALWNSLKEEASRVNIPAWALAEQIQDPYILADEEEMS